MADDDTTTGSDAGGGKTPPKKEKPPQPAPEPDREDRDVLIEHAQRYDSTPVELAGALALAPSNRVQFSEDEVNDLLKEFRDLKVDPLEGTPQAEEK